MVVVEEELEGAKDGVTNVCLCGCVMFDDEDDGEEYNDKIDFFKSGLPLKLPPVLWADCCCCCLGSDSLDDNLGRDEESGELETGLVDEEVAGMDLRTDEGVGDDLNDPNSSSKRLPCAACR